MSIFKKKGTVESLFRIGAGDDEAGAKGAAAGAADDVNKHEVYYVRGRPFIAPTKTEKTPGSTQRPKKNLFGGTAPRASAPASSAPTPGTKKKGASSALASAAPKMAEEEWAALFRNNLLRSCWKPGLTSEEVQHVLTLWERKLVEVMHRWMHPDLWLAARKWKRRTLRLDLIGIMIKNIHERQMQYGLTKWRRWGLLHRHPILKTRGRRGMKRWHAVALMSKTIASCRLKTPFAQLKRHCRDGMMRRRRMRSAIYKFQFRNVVTAFNTWEGHLRATNENNARITRVLKGWKGGIRRGFNTWKHKFYSEGPARQVAARFLNATMYAMFRRWSTDYKNFLDSLRRTFAYWLNAAMARGLNSWKARLEEYRTMLRAAVRLLSRRLLMVLNTWRGIIEDAARRRMVMTSAFETMRGSKTRAALNSWRENTIGARAALLPMQRGLSYWLNRNLSRGFASFVEDHKRFAKIRGVAVSLTPEGRQMRRALMAWDAMAAAMADRKRRLGSALNEMRGRGVRKGWFTWLEELEKRRYLVYAVSGLLNRKLRLGFTSWAAAADEEAAKRARMSGVVSSFKGTAKAFNRWLAFAEERLKLRRAGSGFSNQDTRKALNRWIERADEEATIKRRMESAVREMQGQGVRKGWNVWAEVCADRERMHRAAASLFSRAVGGAFRVWLDEAEELRTRRARARGALRTLSPEGRAMRMGLNSWIERAEQAARMRKAASSMMNKGLKTGMNSWTAWVDMRLEQLALMHRAAHGLQSGLLRAFQAWAARLEEGDDIGTRAIKHMLNRQLSGAWNSWQASTQLRMLAMAAVQRLRSRKLKQAVNMWAAGDDGKDEERERLVATARRMKAAQGTLKALNSWKEQGREYRLMKRAGMSMRNVALKRSVNGWWAFTEARLEQMRKLQKGFASMRNGNLRKAWGKWEEMAFKPNPMHAALSRWANGVLVAGLNSWKEHCEELRLLRKSMAGMTNASLKRAFTGWMATALGQAEKAARIEAALATLSPEGRAKRKALNSWGGMVAQQRLMRKAGGSFFYRKARLAFNGWAESVAALLDRRERARAALQRLSPEGRAMTKALNTWVARKEMHRLMLRAGASLFYSKVSKAFRNWDFVLRQAFHIEAALSKVRNSKLLAAWNTWLLSPTKPTPMKKAAGRMRNRPLAMAFEQWYGIYETMQQLQRSMAHLVYSGMSKGLRTWLEYLDLLDVKARALYGLRNGGLKKGFNSWVVWTEERFEALALLERAAGGIRGGPKKAAWNTWVDRVFGEPDPLFRALAHFMNKEMARAYLLWVEETALWLVMMNALNALRFREVKQAINKWREYNEQAGERKERMRATIARMTSPVVKAWNKWAHLLELLAPLRAGLFRLRNRELVKCMGSWRGLREEKLRMQRALAAMRPETRAMRNGLKGWMAGAEAAAARLAKLTAKAKRVLMQAELKAFNAWKPLAEERQKMRHALGGIFHGKLKKALNAWMATYQAELAKRAALQDTLKKMSPEGRAMLKVLNQWKPQMRDYVTMRAAVKRLNNRQLSKCFESWQAMMEELMERRARMQGALTALTPDGRKKRAAMNKLKACLESYRLMMRAGGALFHRQIKKALNDWVFVIDQKFRIQETLMSLANAKLQKAFNTWVKSPPHPMYKTLARMTNRPLARAFTQWVSIYDGMMRARRSMMHMVYSGLSKGLRSWMEYMELLDKAARALHGMRSSGLRKGFNGWVIWTEERFEALALMEKSMGGIRGGPKKAAFNKWADLIYGPPDPMFRALAHLVYRELSMALRSWVAAKDEWLVMKGALKRLSNRQLSKCFESWQERMEEECERRARMGTVLAGFQGGLRKAFNQWMHIIELLEPMRAALHRLKNRQLSKAFEAWQAGYEEALLMKKAASSILHGPLKRGLMSWKALVEAAAAKNALMRQAVMKTTPVGKAFNTWHSQLEAFLSLRRSMKHWSSMQLVKAMGSWEQLVTDKATKKRAMMGFFKSGCKKAINAWKAFVEERAEQRARARAALRRLSPEGRAKTKAWNAWTELVEMNYTMKGALKRLFNRQLSKGFESWQAMMEQAKRISQCLNRVANAKLLRAFNSWRASPSKPDPMMRAASRMRNKPLSMAFDTWWGRVEEAAFMRRSLAHMVSRGLSNAWRSWEEYLEMRELMRRAGAKLANSSLNRCFNRWCAWREEKLENGDTIKGALTRMLNRRLSMCFETWQDLIGTVNPRDRALKHMMNRSLSKGWRAWEAVVIARARARQALAHFAGQGLVKALGAWEEYVELQNTIKGALRRLFSRQLSKCFESWQAAMEGALERKERMRAVLAGFSGPQKKAFNSWLEYSALMYAMRGSVVRLKNRQLSQGFETWQFQMEQALAQKARMRAALYGAGSGLRKGLNSWLEWVENLRLARKALGGMRNGGIKRGLMKWLDFVEDRYAMQERARSAVMKTTPQGKAFNSWVAYLEGMGPMRRAMSHLRNSGLSKCWSGWCAYLEMLETKRSCLAHLFHRELSRGWRAWEARMAEAERLAAAFARMRNMELMHALARWSRSAEERDEKLRRMRGIMYSFGPEGRKIKKSLNSWRELVSIKRRMYKMLASVMNNAVRKAWNRWYDRGVKGNAVNARMLAAFNTALRKGFNSWRETHAYDKAAKKSLMHWKNAGLHRALRKWAGGLENLLAIRRSLAHLMHRNLVKGLNGWLAFMERLSLMRSSLMAFVHAASKRALNSWVAEAAKRKAVLAKFHAAAFTLRNVEVRKVMNQLKGAAERMRPLKRAMSHWKNQPLSKALAKLVAYAAQMAKIKGLVYRWKNQKLGGAFNTWIERTAKKGSVRTRAIMGIINRPQRQALNSWLAYAAGRRRILGLLNSWANPGKKRGFNQWRAVTSRRRKGPPKSPNQWRMIKAMTWRECCSWLTRVGIPVSRSPPTLIRTLKEGFVYQELVRKISPAYYVRHKVAHCHETNGVFLMVQQFLDTELVISFIGCQKLDVIALEAGKAIDHLQLVMLFKTLLEGATARTPS